MHSGFQTPIVESPANPSLHPLAVPHPVFLQMSGSTNSGSASPGTLPKPGQPRRDAATPLVLPGLTANSRAAAVSNAETNLALDIQSFGLQNQQLQHALSSMLKAIVSLSEDHKLVKGQLETFQNATREAQTAIAMDLDSVANKLMTDFLTKKEWMEGRYDDQRRTDRLATSFAEYQQEQLTGFTSVLPRLTNVETQLTSVREEVTRHTATMATLDVVDDLLHTRDVAAAEQVAINAKRYSTIEHELHTVRSELNRTSSSLRTDIGVASDRVDEAASEIVRLQQALAKLRSDVDATAADTAKMNRTLTAADDTLSAEVKRVTTSLESTIESMKQSAIALRRVDEERITKAENMFNFQVATFETVLQEHGLRIRSMSSDAETIKGEVSAFTHSYDVIRATLDSSVAKLSATVDAKAHEVNELAASLRRDMASIERNSTKWAENFRTDVEAQVEELSSRFKASEQRKKAQDDAFRELMTGSVADEANSVVKSLEARLTMRVKEGIEQMHRTVEALKEDSMQSIEGALTRVAACEEVAEGAVGTIGALADTVSRIRATSDDASKMVVALCEVLGMDAAVITRLTTRRPSSPTDESEKRALLNRYLRALPWFPRPQSPGRGHHAHVPSAYDTSRPVSPPSRATSPTYHPSDAALQHRLGDYSAQRQPPARRELHHRVDSTTTAPPVVDVSRPSSPTTATDNAAHPHVGAAPAAPSQTSRAVATDNEVVVESKTRTDSAPPARRTPTAEAATNEPANVLQPHREAQSPTPPMASPIHQHQDLSSTWHAPPTIQTHDSTAGPNTDSSQPPRSNHLLSPRPPAEDALGYQQQQPHDDGARYYAQPSSYVFQPTPRTPAGAHSAPHSSSRPRLGVEINNDPSGRGVVVVRVEEGGLADRSGIAVGDVVKAFGGAIVESKEDFVAAFVATVEAGQNAAVVSIIPGGRATAPTTDLTLFFFSPTLS